MVYIYIEGGGTILVEDSDDLHYTLGKEDAKFIYAKNKNQEYWVNKNRVRYVRIEHEVKNTVETVW
jgi:hypothetical protein